MALACSPASHRSGASGDSNRAVRLGASTLHVNSFCNDVETGPDSVLRFGILADKRDMLATRCERVYQESVRSTATAVGLLPAVATDGLPRNRP